MTIALMKPCFLSLLSPGVTCSSLSLLVPLRHACTPRAREDAEEPGEHPQRLPPACEVGPPAPGVPCAWERVVPSRPPTCRIRRGIRAAQAEGGAGRGHRVQPQALRPVTQGFGQRLCPWAAGQVWAQSWLSQLGLVGAVPLAPVKQESGCCSAPHSSQDAPTTLGDAAQTSGG